MEAGLRTFDKWQPFPEEINRRMISAIADLHFAPTQWSRENLIREGISENQVFVTGNTVVDALQMINKRPAPAEVLELVEKIGLDQGETVGTGYCSPS